MTFFPRLPFACCLLSLVLLTTGCQSADPTSTDRTPRYVLGPTLIPTHDGEGFHVAAGLRLVDGRIDEILDESTASRLAASDEASILRVPEGGVAMPGIIESHGHLLGLGQSTRRLDLRSCPSAEAVAARVAEQVAITPRGTWIQGRGWNQELWPGAQFPDRMVLDAVAPDHPVVLSRVDGHAVWANSAALRVAGLDAQTADPAGGEIIRRRDGAPTGVFVDNAEGLVMRHVPTEGGAELVARDLLAAQDLALRLGVTTFVDAGISRGVLKTLRDLYDEDRMKMRVYAMKSVSTLADAKRACGEPPILGAHGGRLDVRALKMYADGALGSRGAWLLADYRDRPGHRGLPVTPPTVLREAASLAMQTGYQLCVHAIGDRANREVLDAVEAAEGRRADHRFRIEHAQILHPDDIARFERLGVVPSMQTCHAASDGPWVPDRLGASRTAAGAYAWRSLREAGCVIPNGTDTPVEDPSPWRNLYTALRRENPGENRAVPFLPAQGLDRPEAVNSLTAWGAYGTFAERRRGRIAEGFDADLIVVDRNPLEAPLETLAETRVLATLVAGEVVYRSRPDEAPMAFVPSPRGPECCVPHGTWSANLEAQGAFAGHDHDHD